MVKMKWLSFTKAAPKSWTRPRVPVPVPASVKTPNASKGRLVLSSVLAGRVQVHVQDSDLNPTSRTAASGPLQKLKTLLTSWSWTLIIPEKENSDSLWLEPGPEMCPMVHVPVHRYKGSKGLWMKDKDEGSAQDFIILVHFWGQKWWW